MGLSSCVLYLLGVSLGGIEVYWRRYKNDREVLGRVLVAERFKQRQFFGRPRIAAAFSSLKEKLATRKHRLYQSPKTKYELVNLFRMCPFRIRRSIQFQVIQRNAGPVSRQEQHSTSRGI